MVLGERATWMRFRKPSASSSARARADVGPSIVGENGSSCDAVLERYKIVAECDAAGGKPDLGPALHDETPRTRRSASRKDLEERQRVLGDRVKARRRLHRLRHQSDGRDGETESYRTPDPWQGIAREAGRLRMAFIWNG